MDKEPEIKKLTGYISLIYMWALLYACIGLFTYYIHFNVNIFQYLDLMELIQISLTKFAVTTILMIMLLLSSLVFEKDKFKDTDSLNAGPESNFKVVAYPLYTFAILALLCVLIKSRMSESSTIKLIYNISLTGFFTLLPIYFSLYYIYKRKDKKEILTVLTIVLVSYSCIISVCISQYQYENIKGDALMNSVYVGDRKLNSSKHYYYIGHTRNYVFFYNDSLKATDVYPASLISRMTIK